MNIQDFSPLWGSWKIGKILGKGTYGTVYEVSKEEYGKTYYSAVKHMSIPMTDEEKELLLQEKSITPQELAVFFEKIMLEIRDEILTCYKLKGDSNIVSYEDHKIIPKKDGIGYDLFIRMEKLTTLSSKLKETVLSVDEVLNLGIDICRALEVLQSEKIIHRDIKPSNLFINEKGKYKLGDFGVAKELNKEIGEISIKGTFRYMPPEVYKGGTSIFKSDIYSLGLVLYFLLDDDRFYPKDDKFSPEKRQNEIFKRRMNGEILKAPINADSDLSEIILKACAFNPDNRWKSAREFREALENYKAALEQKQNTSLKHKSFSARLFFSEVLHKFSNISKKKKTVIFTATLSVFLVSVAIGMWFLIFNQIKKPENEVVSSESSVSDVTKVTKSQTTKKHIEFKSNSISEDVIKDIPQSVLADTSCRQFIYLKYKGTKNTRILLISKSDEGNFIEKEFAAKAEVGQNGVTEKKKENDKSTPYGVFDIPFCFGYNAPSTGIKFIKVNPNSEWVCDSDSDDYNILKVEGDTGLARVETMSNFFEYSSHTTSIYVAYNGNGLSSKGVEKNKGSMLTINGVNWDKNRMAPTAGSIQLQSRDLEKLLSMLDSSKNPKIIIH